MISKKEIKTAKNTSFISIITIFHTNNFVWLRIVSNTSSLYESAHHRGRNEMKLIDIELVNFMHFFGECTLVEDLFGCFFVKIVNFMTPLIN